MPSRRIERVAYAVCIAALWIAAEGPLLADASYKETTQITGGSIVGLMKMAGTFSSQARKADQPITSEVYVSGNRMARVRPDGAEIIDLDAETITNIDSVKHQYTTTTFDQMRQRIEEAQAKAQQAKPDAQKQAPDQTQDQAQNPAQNVDMSFDVHVRETGATKEVSGLSTKEAILTMAMNATDKKTQQTGTLGITNDMWMAPSTPVYDEVRAFNEKFAKKMGQVFSGNQAYSALLQQPGASKGMADLAKEVSKLQGVPVLQVMRMGSTANGQPLPAASEGPLPASTGPAMPSAGDVAQQTATSMAASKLGAFGALGAAGFGGFGHKKKAADPAQTQTAAANGAAAGTNAGAENAPGQPAAPASSVLIESSTTLSDFSTAPVDGSHFQVPAGYQQVATPSPRSTS
jgi:DNA polymerase III gamma/tau subunit